ENGISDRRFILVTDLGILVKKDTQNRHHVFVQSLDTGAPIAGANVQLVGRNGLALLSATTDAQGRVEFPEYKTQNNPMAGSPMGFVVRRGSDLAFLKFGDYHGYLNYSRFDVGGE